MHPRVLLHGGTAHVERKVCARASLRDEDHEVGARPHRIPRDVVERLRPEGERAPEVVDPEHRRPQPQHAGSLASLRQHPHNCLPYSTLLRDDGCSDQEKGGAAMRRARARNGWIVALAVVGLLVVGAAPAAADDAAPPTTVPTMTSPSGIDAVVSGEVTLSATTTNPSASASIQFV